MCQRQSIKYMRKTTVKVELINRKISIFFIVVQHMVPSLIEGIEIQNKFGLALQLKTADDAYISVDETSDYVCNIEARFVRKI